MIISIKDLWLDLIIKMYNIQVQISINNFQSKDNVQYYLICSLILEICPKMYF